MTETSDVPDQQSSTRLAAALALRDGERPFPWQEALLARFMRGNIDRALDIPTGLGKTAVMAIWLVAYAATRRVPRRLVYIVDRRAVVDQATTVAERLRDVVANDLGFRHALGLGDRGLTISTLRGQHVDNRQWLETPSLPAIIVGTVDKIGSALLFRGYGVSNKMRVYHAGLLGADSFIVLDEAHLVPPFAALLATIADGSDTFGPRDESLRHIVRSMAFMALSATARNVDD
ncbi:MAG: DEAD/DEAH box helicase, partial [Vicinamibacterales bacterium]